MRKGILILSIVSICSANGLLIEASLNNRFSPKFANEYATVLQGPDISVNYLFTKTLMLGVGIGPLMMNGFVPSEDTLGAVLDENINIYADLYYVLNLGKANSLLCFGGKSGRIADTYYLIYNYVSGDTVGGPPLIEDYEVTDNYFTSLGAKFLIGFKHFRFVANAFQNLGVRKEIKGANHGYTIEKSSFITAFQFDLGLVFVIGKTKS
jgi:hypothetical protein